jgi:tetratricopeptide (TPR) repeat protein
VYPKPVITLQEGNTNVNLKKDPPSPPDIGLVFIFVTLLWLLVSCTGDQTISAITPTATPTPLPSPTHTSTAAVPVTATPLPTATATPTVEIAAEAQEFYYRGITYTAVGAFEEALDSFNQAITLQPDYALAYLERGKLYLLQKQVAEAKSDFHYALELTRDPEVKAEVKALLEQVTFLQNPVPTPTVEQVTPAPQATPILIEGSDREAPLNQPFSLAMSQTAQLKETNFTLTFLEVLEDSRCPKLVNCFWSGQARIAIRVQTEQAETEQFELNTNPALKEDVVSYAGYSIRLIGLDPYPEDPDQPIPPEAYQATLLVSSD